MTPAAPDPRGTGAETELVVIEPRRGRASLDLRGVWTSRELLYFLVWRDIKVRYKQTTLGVLWVVVQPVMSVVVFSLLFGGLLKVPSGDVPYPLFAFAALLPWTYFASSLARTATSVVGSASLITKVYFPRLVLPVSAVLSGLVDFGVSFAVLLAMMLAFRVQVPVSIVLLPLLLALTALTALSFGIWLAALNVRFRDVNFLLPFGIQLWMYGTPVIYATTLLPERWRPVLALNPMTGVVEGFRWCLLGHGAPGGPAAGAPIAVGATVTALMLVGGLLFFARTERTFADTI